MKHVYFQKGKWGLTLLATDLMSWRTPSRKRGIDALIDPDMQDKLFNETVDESDVLGAEDEA